MALPGTLVGREHELAALRARLEAAVAGTAGVALLAGEPGIGKTRLAEELAQEAHQRDCRVLWGRCWDGEGAPAFWPWIQIIRAHVHDRDPAGLRDDLGSGAAAIAQIVAEVHDRLPDLASPRLPRSGDMRLPVLPTDPAQARFRLFDSVATFLRTISREQPLVLVLDDLHAADVPSLLLLRFLAQSLTTGPRVGAGAARVLVIGTYRDADVGQDHPLAQTFAELAREPVVDRLDLAGLEEEAVARCVAEVAGRTPPPPVVAAIARGTNGNPFFVTEIARLLATTDVTTAEAWGTPTAGRRRPTRGQPGSAAWTFGIPPSVRAVIMRRLERLSLVCNQILTVAAVIGREFSLGTLEAVCEAGGEPLLDALAEAESARIIAARSATPGHYQFAHALIRETLSESLPAARRIRLHQQVGLALEARFGPTATEHLAELAHHFVQAAPAGDVERADGYARHAADHALLHLAHEEAARLYQMALTAQQAAPVVDVCTRAELSLALGDALTRAGDFDAARASYLQTIEDARRLSPCAADDPAALLARAALGVSMAADTGRHDPALIGLLEEAAAALSAEDSALRARVLARLAVAQIPTAGAEERRMALSEEAVAMA
ncbi:MAG: ATP-binding protein, partial [Dehalococcoidia bacterium]